MEKSVITRSDLALLLDVWDHVEKLIDMIIILGGKTIDTDTGASAIGSLMGLYNVILNVSFLFYQPDDERTDHEENTISDIIKAKKMAPAEKAFLLSTNISADHTVFNLEDEIILVHAYESILDLDHFCQTCNGSEARIPDSFLNKLYQLEDLIMRSSPLSNYPIQDYDPVLLILKMDLSTEQKARLLLEMN